MQSRVSRIPKRWLTVLMTGALLWAGIGAPPPQPAPTLFAGNETLTDLAPVPGSPPRLLVVSENGVYLKSGQGESRLLRLEGKKGPIQKVMLHPRTPDKIYLLTERSLWQGDLKNRKVGSLFQNLNPSHNRFTSLAAHPENPDRLFLGTERGLYQSGDGGKSWLRPYRWPENQSVQFVAALPTNPPKILIAAERELFFSQNGGLSFESGFSLPLKEEEILEDPEEELPPQTADFTSLAFSWRDPERFWIGTSEGVFESPDGGAGWQSLPVQGLGERSVLDLVYSDLSGELIAATRRGVFKFHPSKRRWEPFALPLFRPPSALALVPVSEEKEILFVASGNKILESAVGPVEIPFEENPLLPSPERLELFRRLIAWEPGIREIHRQAIRYGQLGGGRFRRWQGASRLGAFLPDVRFGKDFSTSSNIDIDRGGSSDPDQYIAGPDNQGGGWDFGLTWDLADFFFSTDQTAIDSRAKLWVELREEILSQTNRLYFERRRAQTEAVFNGNQLAGREYLDLLLRMDELTAELDALTNGFLSERVREIYRQHPELNHLWAVDI